MLFSEISNSDCSDEFSSDVYINKYSLITIMKLLIPTTVIPPKQNIRTIYVQNISKFLKEKTSLEIIWINISSEKINSSKKQFSVFNFNDFSNSNDLLNEIKPDCVLISSSWESIQYSLSLSCKSLKIPIFSFFIYDFSTIKSQSDLSTTKNKLQKLTMFFSKTSNSNNKSSIKGIFFLKKYLFLMKTRIKLGVKISKLFKLLINDFLIIFLERYPPFNKFCDYYLLPDKSWILTLTNSGIDNSKLILTGNPFWDNIYEKISKYELNSNSNSKNQIKLLIVTDSLVEHGIWSNKKRNQFLTQIISTLSKNRNISFDFKIHPSTENLLDYEKLFKELKINSKIFQNDDLWDLISQYDLVISYGSTTAHSEFACGGVKLIIFNPDDEFYTMPMVDDAILNGHVLKCTKINCLITNIKELHNKKIQFSQKFITSRNDLIFQFKGKSGKNVANTILSKIKK
jgi:UDP-N-acetylglucosamine:LPS N-acetylglucosamine transferase